MTGLPVVRAERAIDDAGAPVGASSASSTGTCRSPASSRRSPCSPPCSTGRDAVVMSNEWSASSATIDVDGRDDQPPVVEEPGLRDRVPRRARTLTADRPSTTSPPAAVHRAAGSPSGSPQLDRVPPRPSAAATAPSTSIRPQRARPLVRRVRQVLLHRPDPGAVHGRRTPAPRCSAAPSRSPTRRCSPRFRRLLGDTSGTRSRGSASATSTSAASPSAGRRPARPRGNAGARRRWSAEAAGSADPPPIEPLTPPRRRPLHPGCRMPPTISWSDLRGRRVGVWGLGVEGRATTCASCARARHRRRCWSTTARPTARRGRSVHATGGRARRARSAATS